MFSAIKGMMMTKKGALLLIFNALFFPILILIMLYQASQVEGIQNLEVDRILKKISMGVNRDNIEKVMTGEDRDKLLAIWYKTGDESWYPIVRGEKFDAQRYKSPFVQPSPKGIRRYTPDENFSLNDGRFIVWVNRFDLSLYIRNFARVLLYLLVIYFIVFFLIFFLFQEREEEHEHEPAGAYYYRSESELPAEEEELYEEQESVQVVNKVEEPEPEPESEPLIEEKSEPVEEQSSEVKLNESGLIEEFKELWRKDFKISNNFKDNFPFDEIDRLVRFGIGPEEYISRGLELAARFFSWQEPALYIFQKDSFIENRTKRVLDEGELKLPEDGTAKGDVYIPLFPYNKSRIFGYFYFRWDSREVFYIADIIFFLKYLFSEEAKHIFANSRKNREVKNEIEERLEAGEELYFGAIQVDDKERLLVDLEAEVVERLDSAIFENIKGLLSSYKVHNPFPFYYVFYGNSHSFTELMGLIEIWLFDNDIHNYFLSSQDGNIAVTLSCGLSTEKRRAIDGATLITEAEEYLAEATENGGSQLVAR